MVAITGSRRYNLPMFPGYRSPGTMYGGNIFKRGFDFIKRNVGRVLRSGSRVLPHAIDAFVRLGTERGHIPSAHKKVYDDYRKYVHMLPGLLNRPIQKLEERLNTGLRPVTELDSRVDDIAKKVIDQFEKKAVKAFTPESKKESSEQEGGALHGDVISIKTKKKGKKSTASRAKKTTSKGAKVATKMKLPPMESQSYRDLIMSKLLKGSGLMTHSLSTE